MKHSYLIVAIVGLLILLILSGCENTTVQKPADRQADETAIRSLLAANFAASTARDAAGVAATFMLDGDGWIAGLSRAEGRESIRKGEENFVSLPGFQGYDGSVESIRFVSRDAAIVEISGTTSLIERKFDEKTTIVVARTDEGWQIAAWRVMNFDKTLLNLLTSDSQSSDQQQIKEVLSGWVAAAQVGDPDAYITFVTSDAVMMWDGQPAIVGHQAIHEFMSSFSGDTSFDFQGQTDEIQVVGDWALHRHSGVAVMSPADGGEVIRLDRKYIDILRRENGTWKVSHHIYNLNE